ncbi:MAG: type I-C CRISPR-associated protein Cas8c/Csd1 [Clostridioides sp.]|jgi:CRISPR-associated protein Csd1|nr:type I-C CRISPR-associated protein Cas8c/Csd1 [Clostridioides sp.]
MSFWQGLVDSYNVNSSRLKKDFPLSTTSISNNTEDIIIVKIDGDGNYLGCDKIEKRKSGGKIINIIFPVTEESLSRSSGISPHPVFEQFDYLSGEGDKFDAYICKLEQFAKSRYATRQIKAIYSYISKKGLKCDLIDIKLKGNTNIVFEVQIPGEKQTKVWESEDVFNAWHDYYISQKDTGKSLDFISGKIEVLAKAHPKKVSNGSGNAKLISSNDKTNYTFRGTFLNPEEALSIGYENSQKAHQFLRFLIRDRGLISGEQVIITYQIGEDSSEMEIKNPVADSKNILDMFVEPAISSDVKNLSVDTGSDFSKALREAIFLGKRSEALIRHKRTAIIILDAATTGRLSVTYYQELDNDDYLEKIANWHESCKFNFTYFDENKLSHKCIKTPSVDWIIKTVYGKPKSSSDEGYKKFQKSARERLIHCIFNGESVPREYVNAAVRKASTPMSINGDSIREIMKNHNELVSVACALVKKSEKEVYELSLERENTKRDYLFGRLLGAADKLEIRANDKAKNERATTALRYMSAFSRKPYKTWLIIRESLVPYIQSLKGKKDIAYSEIEEIENMFEIDDFENDSPLSGTYLLGYSCEKAWITEEVIKLSKNKVKVGE